jgi:4-diphosphocytidyl-2-C-methyl-D-erythritol kinase
VNTILANAKINLSLAVTGKRSDNYHNLLSLNVPVAPWDKITISEAGEDFFSANHGMIPADNSVVSAVKYLKRYVNENFHIKLEKNIPIMAGFGGGSSDAAAILKFFNAHYGLNFDGEKLQGIAGLFGADCPFFIKNKPAIVSGMGDNISEIGGDFCLNLARYSVLLFKPNFGISTGEAYRKLDLQPAPHIREDQAMDLIQRLISSVNNLEPILPIFNTFSKLTFAEHRELTLLGEALPCSMTLSGSGSGCFCIFLDPALEPEISRLVKFFLGENIFIQKSAFLLGV